MGGPVATDLDADGARNLALAILKRAVLDVQRGRPCNGQCAGGIHVCANAARAWLATDGAEWADALDMNAAAVREWANGKAEDRQ